MNDETETVARTVLLVDEDLKSAMNCKSGLEAEGFRVMHTHTGREALELFTREKIDLIVAEVSLPDMPGTDLIEIFAARKKHVPIVVNTSDLGYRQSFRSWAADAIVEKSADVRALFAMVAAFLPSAKILY